MRVELQDDMISLGHVPSGTCFVSGHVFIKVDTTKWDIAHAYVEGVPVFCVDLDSGVLHAFDAHTKVVPKPKLAVVEP